MDDNDALYARLPLTDVPLVADLAPYSLDWLAHPAYDDYWRRIAPKEHYGQITVPPSTSAAGTTSSWAARSRTTRA